MTEKTTQNSEVQNEETQEISIKNLQEELEKLKGENENIMIIYKGQLQNSITTKRECQKKKKKYITWQLEM